MIVIASMTIFFGLVITLVFQTGIRINQRNQINALESELSRLERQADGAERDITFYESQGAVTEFALARRFMRPGTTVFRQG